MNLINTLKSIGLDEKQSAAYLACLQLGEDTVFRIAKTAAIKRPTAYIALIALAERGLVSLRKTKKATLYSAASPKKLLDHLKQRTKNLEEAIPHLLALHNQQPNKPEIQLFEGKEGVIHVYHEAFDAMKKNVPVIFYGSIIEPMAQFATLFEEYKNVLKGGNVQIRELLPDDDQCRAYAKSLAKFKNTEHQIRYFHQSLTCGRGDNIIYGNRVVFLPYHKNLYYIISIENADLVATHRTLFEQAWKAAIK